MAITLDQLKCLMRQTECLTKLTLHSTDGHQCGQETHSINQ